MQHITTLINARQAHQKKFSLEGKYFTGDCSHTHEKDVMWPKMQLYNTVHEQTIICMQLFAGQMVTPFFNVKEKNHLNDKYEITNS